MLSTMSLDFMLFDKPVINTVFGNPSNGLANDQRFLQYAHIAYVVDSNATYITKNKEELLAAVHQALSAPNSKLVQQKELLATQIGAPLEGTSKRITAVLYQWS